MNLHSTMRAPFRNLVHMRLQGTRCYGTARPPTAVVKLNLGGPANAEEVHPFLLRLFSDREIIQLPIQDKMGPWIARRRTPSIQKQYEEIGGGSPIKMWTDKQGEGLCSILDKISPESAPHKHYIAFRYAKPLTEDALLAMKEDGVKRAIAFTQYPQYSCSTTGGSLNELYRKLHSLGLENEFEWSVIDRWPVDQGLVKAFATHIQEALERRYSPEERSKAVLLFSAHSLPMKVVNRGDPYPQEVAATVHAVMEEIGFSHPYRLVWQSKVGPLPWLGMQTQEALTGFADKGETRVLVVPIAFTSDHIETLFEIDIEYGEEAKKLGLTGFHRIESLNDDEEFVEGMAKLVKRHLESGEKTSTQYRLRCPGCTNHYCGEAREFFLK